MKESFVFYRSFYESFKDLPDESRLKLYDNLCEMALNGNDINGLTGIEKSIFTLIRPQIEANYKRYLNGLKGNKSKQKKSLGKHDVDAMGEHDLNANVNVNDNVNENIYKKKYFDNEELNETFLEFLEMRKKIKAVNTPRAINILIKKLNNYDDKTKLELINRSIINSWKDIYVTNNKEITSKKKYNDLN